jgi:hypothetical protein
MTEREKRYTDEEVALILRKASQLEARPTAGDAADGLSLTEIRRIAQEAGISPDLVTRVAALLDVEGPSRAAAIFGGQAEFRAEHEGAGVLPREHYGDVVDAIRRVIGQQGQTKEVLDALEWKSVGETSQITVVVRPKDATTAVHVLANRGASAGLVYLPVGVAGLLAGLITGAIIEPGLAGGLTIMGTAAAAAFLTARTIGKAATRRFEGKFATLVQSVTNEVERHSIPAGAEPASLPGPDRLAGTDTRPER